MRQVGTGRAGRHSPLGAALCNEIYVVRLSEQDLRTRRRQSEQKRTPSLGRARFVVRHRGRDPIVRPARASPNHAHIVSSDRSTSRHSTAEGREEGPPEERGEIAARTEERLQPHEGGLRRQDDRLREPRATLSSQLAWSSPPVVNEFKASLSISETREHTDIGETTGLRMQGYEADDPTSGVCATASSPGLLLPVPSGMGSASNEAVE